MGILVSFEQLKDAQLIMKPAILPLLVLAISTVLARPGPDPDNAGLAFAGGLALGLAKGKFLAGQRRTTHHGSSSGFRIPPEKVALAAGVGIGLVKAGVLSGALNGK